MDKPELNQTDKEDDGPVQDVTKKPKEGDLFTAETWRTFFNVTGGSLFYCLSAVFVTYGIVAVLGPILAKKGALTNALPCIGTLHGYELALLGVLILIVSKKVVDDAISIMVIIGLFMVGTSIALGSVADRGINLSFVIGAISFGLVIVKLGVLKKYAGVVLGGGVVIGICLLMAGNYFGPSLLARSIVNDPSNDVWRRGVWMLLWFGVLVAGGLVIIDAVKQGVGGEDKRPFLQRPVMGYWFALILLAATGVHQYSMAYSFALERSWGDFLPLITAGMLMVVEILRHSGNVNSYLRLGIVCVPLVFMGICLEYRDFISTGTFDFTLISYPPVFLGLSGAAVAGLAWAHKWNRLYWAVYLYVLGVVLTYGYSPDKPYELNFLAFGYAMAISLMAYGMVKRQQYAYLAGVIALGIIMLNTHSFGEALKGIDMTLPGGLAGVCGASMLLFYLVYDKLLEMAFRVLGTMALAGFVLDYLPDVIHVNYLIVLAGEAVLIWYLFVKRRAWDVIGILCFPLVFKLFILSKKLGSWRFVILGFVLLVVGAAVSMRKQTGEGKAVEITEGEEINA